MSALEEQAPPTGTVKADTACIDRLKQLYRSTPMKLDFERIGIMKEVCENSDENFH